MPELSIITITFNNLSGLQKSLDSVNAQGFQDVEHFILDGGSTDGTIQFLNNYTTHPIHFYSEPDNGIYDAMNKGIRKITGEWAVFLNAGDCFNDKFPIHQLKNNSSFDILYGDSQIIYPDGFTRTQRAISLDQFWKGLPFTHQAVIYKSSLLKAHLFNLKYNYCSDFEQLFTCYLNGKTFHYLGKIVCQIEAGGISDQKRHLSTSEVYRINRKLDSKLVNHFYFIPKVIWGLLVVNVKKIIPKKWNSRLVKKKYQ